MSGLNGDQLDALSLMEGDFPPGFEGERGAAVLPHNGSGSESDFAFAFNDSNFSDRVLRIEILPDLPDSKADPDGCTTIADWARNRKRRREEIKKENGGENGSNAFFSF